MSNTSLRVSCATAISGLKTHRNLVEDRSTEKNGQEFEDERYKDGMHERAKGKREALCFY